MTLDQSFISIASVELELLQNKKCDGKSMTYGQTDGQMDGQTDGQRGGRTDRQWRSDP